jgi:hypothetical protein
MTSEECEKKTRASCQGTFCDAHGPPPTRRDLEVLMELQKMNLLGRHENITLQRHP